MTHEMKHCDRPWWKRPPLWFIAIVAVALLSVAVFEQNDKPVAMPYSKFLDQVEAGKIASVTFEGTEIVGRFKNPLDVDSSPSSGTVQRDSFRSRIPDFGDPTLIPALRKQHVAIDVSALSPWRSVLMRIPLPMLVFLGVVLVAALVRLVRGGQAKPGSAASALPAHGIPGLVSRLFAKQCPSESPPRRDSDEPKSH